MPRYRHRRILLNPTSTLFLRAPPKGEERRGGEKKKAGAEGTSRSASRASAPSILSISLHSARARRPLRERRRKKKRKSHRNRWACRTFGAVRYLKLLSSFIGKPGCDRGAQERFRAAILFCDPVDGARRTFGRKEKEREKRERQIQVRPGCRTPPFWQCPPRSNLMCGTITGRRKKTELAV